jgi:hypothetical protein
LSKTKNVVYILIAVVVALVMVLAMVLSSAISYNIEIDDYAVQIWQPGTVSGEPKTLIAEGIVVDDGNHVLTVLDYEMDTLDKLLVISPKYGTFNASIQAIDYRTSATLLQLQDANLPVAEIGDISSLASNQSQRVYIRGWASFVGNRYMRCPADAYISDNISPLFFSISPSQEAITKAEGWVVDESGAVITDKDSKAIGLLATYLNYLLPINGLGYTEILQLAINIDSALALLTDTSHTNGPVVCVALTESDTIDFVPGIALHLPLNNIENLDTTVMGLLDKLGEPLPVDDMEQYFSDLHGFHPEEGIMLIAAFTYPVELHDSSNNLLASAKWIGIQWDRSEGKPNRLIYGSTAYAVEGVYSIEGDISGLVQLVEPILSELGHTVVTP